ncbi:hypothetical protein DN388_03820 [Pseudomonas sp. S12(2018)]|nr:hypothetical protein [Pseudomonas sp. S12(2018)]
MVRRDLLYSERVLLRKSIRLVPSEAANPFDDAIIKLVSGSHTVAHEFHHFSNDLSVHVNRSDPPLSENYIRGQLVFTAQQQSKIMEGRFERVVEAYVEIRNTVAER